MTRGGCRGTDADDEAEHVAVGDAVVPAEAAVAAGELAAVGHVHELLLTHGQGRPAQTAVSVRGLAFACVVVV